MAARLFVSRHTLWQLERGDPTVALGTLVAATFVLKLHDRLANLASPATDELALSLDERRLPAATHSAHASMSLEVHIDWQGQPHLVGLLHTADRSAAVSFEYAPEWLQREDAFEIDPTSLPLQRGAHHGEAIFGAIQDCGPDRWGRMLIERAVRKKVLTRKPYRDIDYVLALDDVARVGALRFRINSENPFLAHATGKLPPLVRLSALLRATDAIHSAQDLRFSLARDRRLGALARSRP